MTARRVNLLLGLVFGLAVAAALCLQYGAYLASDRSVPFSSTWRSDGALLTARQFMAVGADAEAKLFLRESLNQNPYNQSAVERLIAERMCMTCQPSAQILKTLAHLGWHDSRSQIVLLQNDERLRNIVWAVRRTDLLLRFDPNDSDASDMMAELELIPAARSEIRRLLMAKPQWRYNYFFVFSPQSIASMKARVEIVKDMLRSRDLSFAELSDLTNAIASRGQFDLSYSLWSEFKGLDISKPIKEQFSGHDNGYDMKKSLFDWKEQNNEMSDIIWSDKGVIFQKKSSSGAELQKFIPSLRSNRIILNYEDGRNANLTLRFSCNDRDVLYAKKFIDEHHTLYFRQSKNLKNCKYGRFSMKYDDRASAFGKSITVYSITFL